MLPADAVADAAGGKDLEFQDLLLRALDADIDRLERYHRQEMKKARNICRER